jgi:hypothetical protein
MPVERRRAGPMEHRRVGEPDRRTAEAEAAVVHSFEEAAELHMAGEMVRRRVEQAARRTAEEEAVAGSNPPAGEGVDHRAGSRNKTCREIAFRAK